MRREREHKRKTVNLGCLKWTTHEAQLIGPCDNGPFSKQKEKGEKKKKKRKLYIEYLLIILPILKLNLIILVS